MSKAKPALHDEPEPSNLSERIKDVIDHAKASGARRQVVDHLEEALYQIAPIPKAE